jgi:DNA-binding transcriptional regulator YbjK
VPPPNQRHRAELTDAAIALLAESGVHGVTHRAVERRAGLPTGTASNYFRSR